MKANFKELDKLHKEKFLRRVVSPCGNMILYNYTDACTYARNWNKHTLNARGTVYDLETGELVALAFPKFFNFEELPVTDQRRILKLKKFTAYEKMDGSLGIVFNYKGRWYVNTRGSFTSDQAIEGLRLLKEKYDQNLLNTDYTYLCEIITPETKIILDYKGAEMLSCLGIMNSKTGLELIKEDYIEEADRVGLPRPKIYEFNSIDEVISWKKSLGADNEGVVVQYEFSGKIYRVKFKSNQYLEVARILSNVSALSIWGNLLFGKTSPSYLEKIPEEFRYLLDEQQKMMEAKFKEIYTSILSEFQKAKDSGFTNPKELAAIVKSSDFKYRHSFFTLNQFVPTQKDIKEYQDFIESEIETLRQHDAGAERTGRVGFDELRMKISQILIKNPNTNFKKILTVEDAILSSIRPKGNVVEETE